MNWIKKWYYLILLVSTGVVYLICVNDWQVYAHVIAVAKGGYGTQPPGFTDTVEGDKGAKGGSPMGGWNDPPVSGGNDGWYDPSVSGGNDGWNGPSVSGGDDGWNGPSVSGGDDAWESQTGDEDTGWEPGDEDGDWEPGDENSDWQDEPAQRGVSYMAVEDDYFADAVFIGDSRTVGLSEYGGLEDVATFYASTGLSVHKLFTAQIVPVQGQKKKITVEEALQGNTFSKIYFMIGINEMGTGTVDTFMAKYEEAVAHLQELQPDAVIYLQGIMKVTTKRSEQGDYITNEGIEERNERISQLADNEKIFYLDVNPLICDETGGMEASYTHDGVHLKGKYIEIWKQFLKEHAVAE